MQVLSDLESNGKYDTYVMDVGDSEGVMIRTCGSASAEDMLPHVMMAPAKTAGRVLKVGGGRDRPSICLMFDVLQLRSVDEDNRASMRQCELQRNNL